MSVERDDAQEHDMLIDLSKVQSVMHEGSGIVRIIRDGRILYQRRSSYFYLELKNDTEG